MSNVKSSYNFVPAPNENEVFKPDWADQVSHDIPFEDGESGEIEVKLTAMTPIFIRNGHSKGIEENEFSNFIDGNGNKQYFIPATSIKGMLRNVLEIMSFSRLNKNLVNDDKYSFRDLTRDSLYLKNYKSNVINAGWLIEDKEGNWKIEECDELAFIHHEELKKKGFPFRDLFLNTPIEKTAKYKYSLTSKLSFNFKTFTKKLFGNVVKTIAQLDENGKKGTLVFTGQSGKRNEPNVGKASGKVHEFVFFDSPNPNFIEIKPKMKKDFLFIYLDHDKANISIDWKFWRTKLEKSEKIPVFYSKDKDGNLNHFGLAYMYKLPFQKSIHQMIPLNEPNKGLDLATTIFGFTDKDKGLKGRLFIGNAISENAKAIDEKSEIFGSPKASYFPFYLKQDEKINNYKTYEDNASLRGYKRYPVRNLIVKGNYDEKQLANKKVFSSFKPLNKDTEFTFKIRFHNLKRVEIGAILSSLTFHGNNNTCYHNLGAAKPFGYGKVKIEVLNIGFLSKSIDEYMSDFESEMMKFSKKWLLSNTLKELFAMASNKTDFNLEYPTLDEFVKYKKDKLQLESFSKIAGDKFNPKMIKSISNKFLQQKVLELEFNRFEDLSKELNRILIEEFSEFSDENKMLIYKKIVYIFNNHKDSRKRLTNRPFDFEKNIPNWLGTELTEKLKKDLNL